MLGKSITIAGLSYTQGHICRSHSIPVTNSQHDQSVIEPHEQGGYSVRPYDSDVLD
ncbi:hypothetical protein PAXRUDRAFT_824745 [Paxillus rubicundulus Ve08.2h10]|uniref:Uncharacterized protein n=1 Tax=Paxillus rubicundulus Ve08.2h10 TaxID=930991 RepID=A0A0D0E1F8_9AGAM|nr:hypothetical protein PAXRUDRAFT_824745 [Paxillus rubicundulus Ve08.2h10]